MPATERPAPARGAGLAWLLVLTLLAWSAPALAAQLTLTWVDASADEVGFSVERSTGTTGGFAELAVMGPGATTYTDTGLAEGTTYCYRVRAFNETTYSAYSNPACGTTAAAASAALVVLKEGEGEGTVTSMPAGITCGASCSATFPGGTRVTLTAVADPGWGLSGWIGGGCSGTGPCTITLTSPTTVTAEFGAPPVPLTVNRSGTGRGRVTSAPAGISCGATCSGGYAIGTDVTLTAAPASGSTFTGWSGGGCSGTGTCTVTMAAAAAVTARFDQAPTSSGLVVRRAGAGRGIVFGLPAGINCGRACSASYKIGTTVVLAAIPRLFSVFTGWSGACRGTKLCTVKMTGGPIRVTATFAPAPR